MIIPDLPSIRFLPSRSPEQKLHVLGSELFQGLPLILVDGAVDQVRLFLLQEHDPRFHRVLDAQSSDDAGPTLADAVTPIRTLPFRSRIPPSNGFMSAVCPFDPSREERRKKKILTDR